MSRLLVELRTLQALSGHEKCRIDLLGGFRLVVGPYVPRLKNRKSQALIAYLALCPNYRETRQRLAGLLWSESDEVHARASLRQTLRDLRVLTAEHRIDLLDLSTDMVSLKVENATVDVHRVLDLQPDASPDRTLLATRRIFETLLLGFEDVDPAFQVWLQIQRQSLHDQLRHGLEERIADEHLATAHRRASAEALANLDPTHEAACEHLMLEAASRGDVAGALKLYKALWELLDREYEVEPSRRLQALIVALKSGQPDAPWADAGEAAEALPPQHTPLQRLPILVREFSQHGIEPSMAHIPEGFRHELIGRLVRFREWLVFDGSESVGADQAVRASVRIFVIDGHVYPNRDGLGITLTLRDRDSGQYSWTSRHSISLEQWWETLHKIVRELAVAVQANISNERLARLSPSPSAYPPDIFDRWLLGQSLGSSWRPDEEEQAGDVFRSILREAPGFAPAYSSLVQLLNARHLVFPGVMRSRQREREALALALKAVKLDAFDSRAQLCLAWSHALNDQFDDAIYRFRLAHELNDADPWTLISAAQGLAFCAEDGAARQLADQLLGLGLGASRLQWGYLVGTRYLARDYAGCVEAATNAADAILNLGGWKAAALARLGRVKEARAAASSFVAKVEAGWVGSSHAGPRQVATWLLHSFPIRHTAAWEDFRLGLQLAGLPVDDDRPALRIRPE